MEQTLRDQLEEVLRLRHTEAEEQLAREREVFEAKVESDSLPQPGVVVELIML